MKRHKILIISASMILLATSYCTKGDESSIVTNDVLQLDVVQKRLFEIRYQLKLYKDKVGSYPLRLQMLVDKGYLKDIPKNELIINDGSVSSIQDGTADWYYNSMHGIIEPGSKDIADKISTNLKAPQKPSEIIPQKAIQECFESIAMSTNEKQLNDGLEKLRELSGNKLGKILVPQILYYQNLKNRTHRETMMVNYVINKLEIGKGEYLLGVLPYVGTDNPKLSQHICSILDYIESGNTGEPDYSYYYSVLEGYQRTSRSIPLELIRYMYKRDPGR